MRFTEFMPTSVSFSIWLFDMFDYLCKTQKKNCFKTWRSKTRDLPEFSEVTEFCCPEMINTNQGISFCRSRLWKERISNYIMVKNVLADGSKFQGTKMEAGTSLVQRTIWTYLTNCWKLDSIGIRERRTTTTFYIPLSDTDIEIRRRTFLNPQCK